MSSILGAALHSCISVSFTDLLIQDRVTGRECTPFESQPGVALASKLHYHSINSSWASTALWSKGNNWSAPISLGHTFCKLTHPCRSLNQVILHPPVFLSSTDLSRVFTVIARSRSFHAQFLTSLQWRGFVLPSTIVLWTMPFCDGSAHCKIAYPFENGSHVARKSLGTWHEMQSNHLDAINLRVVFYTMSSGHGDRGYKALWISPLLCVRNRVDPKDSLSYFVRGGPRSSNRLQNQDRSLGRSFP